MAADSQLDPLCSRPQQMEILRKASELSAEGQIFNVLLLGATQNSTEGRLLAPSRKVAVLTLVTHSKYAFGYRPWKR
jgi:hypothetical protein